MLMIIPVELCWLSCGSMLENMFYVGICIQILCIRMYMYIIHMFLPINIFYNFHQFTILYKLIIHKSIINIKY